MTATANFTVYSDKSAAKRGFARKFKGFEHTPDVEDYLALQEGKWGFFDVDGVPQARLGTRSDIEEPSSHSHLTNPQPKLDADTELAEMQASAAAFKPTAEQHAEVMAIVQKAMPQAFKELQDAGIITSHKSKGGTYEQAAEAAPLKSAFPTTTFGGTQAPNKPDAELNAALSQHHEDGSDVEQPVVQDAFSAFANSQLTSRPQPNIEPAKATSNYSRVERNRDEANGVKRPSAGTLCAQVWDIATQLSNGDEKPTTKVAKLSEVVKAAVAKGINQYTARTQYARWRVFHGVTGRSV